MLRWSAARDQRCLNAANQRDGGSLPSNTVLNEDARLVRASVNGLGHLLVQGRPATQLTGFTSENRKMNSGVVTFPSSVNLLSFTQGPPRSGRN